MPRAPRALLLAGALCGCDPGADASSAPGFRPLEEAFAIVDTVTLQEVAGDSIGEIRALLELASGNLLVAERYRPRLHLYEADGSVLTSAGRFGGGPGEFRSIYGLAEDSSGDIHAVDIEQGRISIIDGRDLTHRAVFTPPLPVAARIAFTDDGLVTTSLGRATPRLHLIREGEVAWSAFPFPASVHENPYWVNFAGILAVVRGNEIVAGTQIMYPLVVFGLEGDSIGAFGHPPPSFRQIPRVEPGSFSGTSGQGIADFVKLFTTIGGIHMVGADHLVVAHSMWDWHPPFGLERRDYAVDVYRMSDWSKIAEDMALPRGALVLAGGRHLYILVSKPPAPWRIMRAAVRDDPTPDA